MEDPRPIGRIKDPALFGVLHLRWRECVLCGANNLLSVHHINKHPRDDVEANLVMLCGHGTTGCHGLVEARNSEKLEELGAYILRARGDTIEYLYARLGPVGAQDWMRRNLLVPTKGD